LIERPKLQHKIHDAVQRGGARIASLLCNEAGSKTGNQIIGSSISASRNRFAPSTKHRLTPGGETQFRARRRRGFSTWPTAALLEAPLWQAYHCSFERQ
jgi:hypothetical protein